MLKRRYGQGGLYKRGRTWWLKYYVNRYPVYESARTQDKKEAENVLKKRLAEVELNQVPTGQSRSLKVEELLRLLISDYSVHKRASVRQLVSRVDLHLSPLLGPVRAQEFRSPTRFSVCRAATKARCVRRDDQPRVGASSYGIPSCGG